MDESMDRVRLQFQKTGTAKYLSHLDLMRTMQRALNRAEVPIRYSEGFNPHALISILLPLSVGAESLCELMDIRLREPVDLTALPARLTAALPAGLAVTAAYTDGRKVRELKWLRVRGDLMYDAGPPSCEEIEALFARESLLVMRKTKRGEGEFDLREGLRELSAVPAPRGATIAAVVSAQEPVVNPELLAAALRRYGPAPDFAAFTRLELFGEDMSAFS